MTLHFEDGEKNYALRIYLVGHPWALSYLKRSLKPITSLILLLVHPNIAQECCEGPLGQLEIIPKA